MKTTSTLTIMLLLFALLVVLSFILFVIVSQAQLYHYPYYMMTPTPNIDRAP